MDFLVESRNFNNSNYKLLIQMFIMDKTDNKNATEACYHVGFCIAFNGEAVNMNYK